MIGSILRGWLQNAAKEKLFEAAREQLHASPEDQEQPKYRERPCDVGIVFANACERGAFEDCCDGVIRISADGKDFKQGGLRGRHVVLVEAGDNAATAAKSAELLIAGHHPRWVLAAGFATALAPGCNLQTQFLANRLVDSSGRELTIELKADSGNDLLVGGLLTVDRPLRAASEKLALGEQHQAIAADRIAFAVAEVCRAAKSRFMAVQLIHETAEFQPPSEAERIARQKSLVGKFGASIGAMVNRPGVAMEYLQHQEQKITDADKLAKFLVGVILRLTNP